MSLRDFDVPSDQFLFDQYHPWDLSFPCCCCFHRLKKDSEKPCSVCGHNINAVIPEVK